MINQLIGIPLSYLLLWRLGGPEVSSRVVKKINDNNRLFWEVNKTSTNDWLVAVFLTRRLESNTRQMTRELTLSVQANRRYVRSHRVQQGRGHRGCTVGHLFAGAIWKTLNHRRGDMQSKHLCCISPTAHSCLHFGQAPLDPRKSTSIDDKWNNH